MRILPKVFKPKLAMSSEKNQRIYNFLRSHPHGVVSTVDESGNPHAVVMYFTVDDSFTVTLVTKDDTKKHANYQHNNHVMLVVYEPNTQTTVQVAGRMYEIENTFEVRDAYLDMLTIAQQTSESGNPPISKLHAGSYIAYKLQPDLIRYAKFLRPDPGGYDLYETIDFEY